MTSDSDTQTGQLDQSEPTVLHNSPIAYGLGSFGLESAFKVFVGFYMFFYVVRWGWSLHWLHFYCLQARPGGRPKSGSFPI